MCLCVVKVLSVFRFSLYNNTSPIYPPLWITDENNNRQQKQPCVYVAVILVTYNIYIGHGAVSIAWGVKTHQKYFVKRGQIAYI